MMTREEKEILLAKLNGEEMCLRDLLEEEKERARYVDDNGDYMKLLEADIARIEKLKNEIVKKK